MKDWKEFLSDWGVAVLIASVPVIISLKNGKYDLLDKDEDDN